jgi:hypothetical protein
MAEKSKNPVSRENLKLNTEQQEELLAAMASLARRNPHWGIDENDGEALFEYFVVQKLFLLHDDEVFEQLQHVDNKKTGIQEELLDSFMIVETAEEVQLKLFQFKYTKKFDRGVSTKELYAFVERMNKVFLREDLIDEGTLEAYKLARKAFDAATKGKRHIQKRVHCYFVVNGQGVSPTDSDKLEQIRNAFLGDRQAYGFTFEVYGGLDIYNLAFNGRVPIQREVLQLECKGSHDYLDRLIGPNPTGMPERVVQGFVNVNQLIRLVDRYSNNELFERNVRHFLGVTKDVNRRIIATVTSDRSNWFAFMNNGVSITADRVVVDPPPKGGLVDVKLDNMQIINGCQTVNALYHAKSDPEYRDKFQGNTSVHVRIYHVDPANHEFLEALIIATNSQNAIRAEDLISSDQLQVDLDLFFQRIGVRYQRKQGGRAQSLAWLELTKEAAATAFMAAFWKCFAARLRNSASRREIFSRSDSPEYSAIFAVEGHHPESDAPPTVTIAQKAIQILTAAWLDRLVRTELKNQSAGANRTVRASLLKRTYYLVRGSYMLSRVEVNDLMQRAAEAAASDKPDVKEIRRLMDRLQPPVEKGVSMLKDRLDGIISQHSNVNGVDADAALRNQQVARAFEEEIERTK